MPQVKNLVFTLITVLVVPLVFFLLIELGLTAAGVGKSYDYFHDIDIDGVRYYQDNPDFADQFYPPSLNVGPLANTFAVEPSDDRVRVLVWVAQPPWASHTKIMASTGYWLLSFSRCCRAKRLK